MLKSKIKLSSKFLVIFIFLDILLSQGIFIHENYKNVLTSSAFYSKHEKIRDYNYGISFGSIWKGKIQLDLSYEKSTKYFNINKRWDEFTTISLNYYIKPDQIINYGLSTSSSISVRDSLNSSSSFSFMVNGRVDGSVGTGMTYYPYVKIKRAYSEDYSKIINEIDNLDLYNHKNFYEFGFYATFNDLWIRPYFIKGEKEDFFFSGIEIGFWD